jgi:class 3 adenylate cyclase/tetratricopeptide (TPR) repeat protein
LICASCGAENPPASRFCLSCGAPASVVCRSCGATLPAGSRFCNACGARVEGEGETPGLDALAAEVVSERRLVSILFADLVGFTTLSESRDPEEVRELLSRYFDEARRVIASFGGTVEKFIGDAVMAVWGAPVAREDDAERAVRAALELVAAVRQFGAEIGAPGLDARAAVLTGAAAVDLRARGEGMVAGDLVNTASRVQSIAEPGAVLVGDATRRATEASVAYADAGEHELKGKRERVHLYRALRVVAAIGGALKSERLEAPFVGREREFRTLRDLFGACVEDGKAQLTSVIGIAGIGKSRLAWEFYKYTDGLVKEAWYHRGRSLSYGEGVTYWALAEMVRMRARIQEGESQATAAQKLAETTARHFDDPDERRWVETALAQLIGTDEGATSERDVLFAAWRRFFERLAEQDPVIMVFEDMQWADSSLLDFIEYLMEWSRQLPIFVVMLARPEMIERSPTWGAGKRNFTSIYLEPLADEAVLAMLDGMVPGMPDGLKAQILARAEGVPLYAVETLRMLMDKGLVVTNDDGAYRLAGALDRLEIPETLHALIAARLDGLSPEERRVLQDGAVLGKTFTQYDLCCVVGLPEDELEPVLGSLVRKEVLGLQRDPRSPEQGQYSFLQDLLRQVTYDTISKRDRRAKHVTVAEQLLKDSEDEDAIQVVASHYLDAYQLADGAEDAPQIRQKALMALEGAASRAESLAAHGEAQRYLEKAASLLDDGPEKAGLLERAGHAAVFGSRSAEALPLFEDASRIYTGCGQVRDEARVSASIGNILWDEDRIEEGLARMEPSFQVLAGSDDDEDLGTVAAQLARMHFFSGQTEEALEKVEVALGVGERVGDPELLSQALNTKSLILDAMGRDVESMALLRHALEVALKGGRDSAATRAYINLSHRAMNADDLAQAAEYQLAGTVVARRMGYPWAEWFLIGHQTHRLFFAGEWDAALEMAATLPDFRETPDARTGAAICAIATIPIDIRRGRMERVDADFEPCLGLEDSSDLQNRASSAGLRSYIHIARGEYDAALRLAEQVIDLVPELGVGHVSVREAVICGCEAALAMGDTASAGRIVAAVESRRETPHLRYLVGHLARVEARLAAILGKDESSIEPPFRTAIATFEEISYPFDVAWAHLEAGEWLVSRGRGEEAVPHLSRALETFERLGAAPWAARVRVALDKTPSTTQTTSA